MFEHTSSETPWRRIERRRSLNPGADYVEVGECVRCRRGVDRAFPSEYRLLAEEVVCTECAEILVGVDVAASTFSSRPVGGDGAPHAPAPPA
jgi:hypothetical protein